MNVMSLGVSLSVVMITIFLVADNGIIQWTFISIFGGQVSFLLG